MIKLLIADDHKILLDGFISLFQGIKDIKVVATAINGNEVLEKVQNMKVDIALLDINMPERNGVEVCKLLSENHPSIKVVALSMHRENSFVNRMKRFGAKGYMLKDDRTEELYKCIKTVFDGGEYFSPRLNAQLANNRRSTALDLNKVSEREIEILSLIAQGYSNKEVSKELYLSVHTIDSHRKNMLNKFQAKNSADLVRKALEKGLI